MYDQFEPLFADVGGTPTPVLPRDADGSPRVADGVEVLTLEQAAGRFGKSA